MNRALKSLSAAAITVAALLAGGVGVAHAGIEPEAGHKPYLVGHATGVQIYGCTNGAWTLTAPRADLVGHNGKHLMTHFGGPSWQAKDGSKVTAKRVDGVTVDPTAIPWLLLKVDTRTVGADGDRLYATTFIQRINTTGGLAPAAGTCTPANAGEVREIPYTADYVFWKKRG